MAKRKNIESEIESIESSTGPSAAPLRSCRRLEPTCFLHWLTHDGELHKEDQREFATPAAVFAELDTATRPVRPQTRDYNCTLFALWTSIEVLTHGLPEAPPFMNVKVPPTGIQMRELHDRGSVQAFLAKLGLKTTPDHARAKPTSLLLRALEQGPIVVGMKINMFDDDEHVRSKAVRREFEHRDGTTYSCSNMIQHSVTIVGYCRIRGRGGFFITKDTQDPAVFGTCNGCALLPEKEANGEIGELYIISRLPAPSDAKRKRA